MRRKLSSLNKLLEEFSYAVIHGSLDLRSRPGAETTKGGRGLLTQQPAIRNPDKENLMAMTLIQRQ